MEYINDTANQRDIVTAFGGYDHRKIVQDGFFYDDMNLTSDDYPVLSQRKKRKEHTYTMDSDIPSLFCRNADKLCFEGSSRYAKYGSVEKQLYGNASSLVLFNNKLFRVGAKNYWALTSAEATENIEKSVTVSGTGTTIVIKGIDSLNSDGAPIAITINTERTDGNISCSGLSGVGRYKIFSSTYNSWFSYSCNYTLVIIRGSTNITPNFTKGDFISLELNKGKQSVIGEVLWTGLFADGGNNYQSILVNTPTSITNGYTGTKTITKLMPAMDCVCSHNNRLWGCSTEKGEIYCSALGDGTVWYRYEGLSTDSWAATIASPGAFTGCIGYNNSVLFFKENEIIRVSGSSPSNYTTISYNLPGVKAGCDRSLCNLNEVLYYYSPFGLCRYTGGSPTIISEALGNDISYKCIAAPGKGKLYVALLDESAANTYEEKWRLMTYDPARDIWHRESVPEYDVSFDGVTRKVQAITDMASVLGNVYMSCKDAKKLVKLCGDDAIDGEPDWTEEGNIEWYAITGQLGIQESDNKYYSKLQVSAIPQGLSTLSLDALYSGDSDFTRLSWRSVTTEGIINCAAYLKRCAWVRLKLSGSGNCEIYSMSKAIEGGSENDF